MRFRRRRPEGAQPSRTDQADLPATPLPPARRAPAERRRFRRRKAPPPPRRPVHETGRDGESPAPAAKTPLTEVPYRFAPSPAAPPRSALAEGLRDARVAVVLVTAAAVPLGFLRTTLDIFNLTKITVIWLAAILCLGLVLAEGIVGGWRNRFGAVARPPLSMAVGALALVAAGGVSVLTSVNRTTSLLGRYHR